MSSSKSAGRVSSSQVAVGNPASLPSPSTNMQTDGIEPLSGVPYFHVVLSKTHLSSRYGLGPSSSICEELPSKSVPTILKYRGKSWATTYNGQNKTKLFDSVGWEKFAEDNYLKLGDACVFELMKNGEEEIVFKVQILRGEEEPFLLYEFPGTGERDAPFVID